ncbi:MAG: glycosyltransferase family 4 protein [Chloroflexota bacterium]
MRIRFFNTYEPVSPTYRDLLPFLADQGFEIEVVVSDAEYRQGRTPLEVTLAHPAIQIRRIKTGLDSVDRGWKKAWVIIRYMMGAMKTSLFGPPVELNFFLTQPPLFVLWGIFLKTFRGQPYHYLVMDIYPDVAVLDGLLKRKSGITRLLSTISYLGMKHADRVVAIGRCMSALIEERGIPQENVITIPNWANEREVHTVEKAENKLRAEYGLMDKFVVLYSGNLGVSHYFNDILDVARTLKEYSNLQFVFVGAGSRLAEIEEAKRKHQLDNVTLLPYQPIERLAESLSMGDVHFISLRNDFEGIVVPSKAYGAIAAGRPLIYQGNECGEIAQMIHEEHIGAVVPQGDLSGLQKVIESYVNDPDLAIRDGKKSLLISQTKYSRESALKQFLQLFREFQLRQISEVSQPLQKGK